MTLPERLGRTMKMVTTGSTKKRMGRTAIVTTMAVLRR